MKYFIRVDSDFLLSYLKIESQQKDNMYINMIIQLSVNSFLYLKKAPII